MRRILPRSFFRGRATSVAPRLIGKYLVRKLRGREYAGMITEVEAYDGPSDRASHASRGKTPRNAPMFGPPGHWYIYFVYGMHWMTNIVTGKAGYPAAILLRSTEHVGGPGRLSKTFGITRRFNTLPAGTQALLWIEDRKIHVSPRDILRRPRIGVRYAGPRWAKAPYRFVLKKTALPSIVE